MKAHGRHELERSTLPRAHGVYDTPPALVHYLVRSVHHLLETRLGWEAGLADPRVRLLDPAAGEMNFLCAAWCLALETQQRRGGEAGALIRDHLLPHFRGIELLPELQERGRASLRRFLDAFITDTELDPSAPLPAFLGDTLVPAPEVLDFPANVVLGNPPWGSRPSQPGTWIDGLVGDYFQVDGEPLGERNAKWLRDDAVRFLRLAQWKIAQAPAGIAALVLPHNGLEAPTFRGLRAALRATFDEIYAYDLHGNCRKGERGKNGGPDQNVFADIAQGAALLLLVKQPGRRQRVLRADLRGSRRHKLAVLAATDVGTTRWTAVEPSPPAYRFTVRGDRQREEEYRRGLALPEIFPFYTCGVITGCDGLAVSLDRHLLEERLSALRKAAIKDRRLDLHQWQELCRDRQWQSRIRRFLARPFDHRYLLYADYLLERPRTARMVHMEGGDNLALVASRQAPDEPGALVTRETVGHKAVVRYDVSFLFPLYLKDGDRRIPNLAPELLARLAESHGAVPQPEEVLAYVYAVLHDPGYRARYRELLRQDFARIPLPCERAPFLRLAALGRELIGLHLLEDPRLDCPPVLLAGPTEHPLAGYRQALPRYCEAACRLEVNAQGMRFEGVTPGACGYTVGGYPVLPRWLKARANRVLCAEEASTFCRIAAALAWTVDVQERIGEVGFGSGGGGW